MKPLQVITASPEETQRIAAQFAGELADHAVVALHGDLGSGKTCFVHGLAQQLGVKQAITSPTFTMINEYQGTCPLYHMDLYRITDPDQLFSLGLDDYFDCAGIAVIEWAERAGDLLPAETIHITFEVLEGTDRRSIAIGVQP